MTIRTKSELKYRLWILSLIAGTISGIVVALVMTALDWRLNPSGIFHQEHGTHWPFVFETAISWFIPVFLLVGVLTWVVLFLIGRQK